jgi:hypothetical protein
MRRAAAVALLLLAGWPSTASAQSISMDQGVRAAGLWCFPLSGDPKQWVYLPSSAALATDEAGRPQFSFVRYVANEPSESAGASTITAARGGGVFHFLVRLETPDDSVQAAQQFLRRSGKDDEIALRGPIVFAEGQYALVSSVLTREGKRERKVMTSGRAPVLEGNRLAFSFDLEAEQATLLLESLKMATPDVSIVFDMTFSGLTDAYEAKLTVDWSEVRKSEAFSAGASVYFVSADVEAVFDKLRRDNAIKLTTAGSDGTMEGLLTTVYTRLLELMFRPVQIERVPEDERGGLTDALDALVGTKGGALGGRNTTGFGAYAGYQLKDVQSSGVTVLDFNHRASVDRHSFVTFNIGDLYKRYGKNEAYFRAVNLADPTFQQREVHVGVDGALLPEFDKFINSVTVTLRKVHGNGRQTVRELVLDRAAVSRAAGDLRMVYGWDGDDDRVAWLGYDVRTRWSFKGGGSYETEWRAADAPMLDLYAPYERRVVQLTGETAALSSQGVRAVVVQIEYPFFGAPRRQQLVVKPGQSLDDARLEITLPRDQFEYEYSVVWQLTEGLRRTRRGRDGSGLVFVDELPAH